jgi:hypothetical protein
MFNNNNNNNKMKKIRTFILIATSVILLAGCQKDNLDVSGTKWAASLDNWWFTLYFETSSSVIFSAGNTGNMGQSIALPYKVSGNTITLDTKPMGENFAFILEKGEKYLYWDMKSFFGLDGALKFIQQ